MEINLKQLAENQLTPNEYVYLYTKHNNIEFTYNVVDYARLQENEWIKRTGPDEDQIVLRQKTINFLNEDYKVIDEATIKKAVQSVPLWSDEYRKLFPVKNIGGRLLRGDKQDCIKKLKRFIIDQSTRGNIITKELILKATQSYLNEQKSSGYMYTKQANFFIMKEGSSTLAQYLEALEELKESGQFINAYDGSKNLTNDI